jgi:hypothetical protein
MTYIAKLDEWYQTERAAGRVVDMKFFPPLPEDVVDAGGPEAWCERAAKSVYEIVTGQIKSTPLDRKDLDSGKLWKK